MLELVWLELKSRPQNACHACKPVLCLALTRRPLAAALFQVAKDVFGDPGITDVQLGGAQNGPQAVAVLSNSSWSGSQTDKAISFVGRKGTAPQPAAPFRVGPPDGVLLNNLVCTAQMPQGVTAEGNGAGGGSQPGPVSMARPAVTSSTGDGSSSLVVDYMPIQYTSDASTTLFSSSFTQFYFKIAYLGARRAVRVDDIQLQYWFNGPEDDGVLDAGDAGGGDANIRFKLYCSDMTPVRHATQDVAFDLLA